MKNKVLFFIPQLVGGGAERVSINYMNILLKGKFEVHLAVSDIHGPAFQNLPGKITLHDLNSKRTLYSITKIRKLILELQPDIVFSSLIRGHIAIHLALSRIKSKPLIIFRSPNSPKLLLENNKLNILTKYFLDKAYRMANLVLAQTPEMKNEIVLYHKVNHEKVKFLMNPINSTDIEVKLRNCSNPYSKNNINVIAAGRLVQQKGFDFLIRSFSKVVKVNSLFKLYIIGEDTQGHGKELKSIVKSLNLEHSVKFLGFQENPYRFFRYADLYVLSSRWEGLPNTVLECLYLKTPVISTKCIAFLSELIVNYENGFLVEVDNEDEMSNSILNYNQIKGNFSNISDQTENVNRLFRRLIDTNFTHSKGHENCQMV